MRKVQNNSLSYISTGLNIIETGANLMTRNYDSEVAGENVRSLTECVGEMLPITTGVIAAYIFAPCITGAMAFSIAGSNAAYVTYTLSKLGVLGLGGKTAMNKLKSFFDSKYENKAISKRKT